MPAWVPSYTALAICNSPPVASPAANRPGTAVAIWSSTMIAIPIWEHQLVSQVSASCRHWRQKHRLPLSGCRQRDGTATPGLYLLQLLRAGYIRPVFRYISRFIAAIGTKRDRRSNRQQHLRFMQEHTRHHQGRRQAFPVEKGITDSIIADTLPLPAHGVRGWEDSDGPHRSWG